MRSRSSASFFRAFNEFSAVWPYTRVNSLATRKVTSRKKLISDILMLLGTCLLHQNDGFRVHGAICRKFRPIQARLQFDEANEVTYGTNQWSIPNASGC